MALENRLDAYHFYEDDWDSYEVLAEAFEHDVPAEFNMATYVCDRWATDRGRVALFAENSSGDERSYTFWELQKKANRLANYLDAQGVEFGDRVGVNTPQRPETLIAHLAIWKLGAVSVPLSTLFGPDAVEYRLDDCSAVACVIDAENIDAFRAVKDDIDTLETVVTTGAVDPERDETDYSAALTEQPTTFETATTKAEDDAMLIYTSGTTGQPKGVAQAHQVLLGYLPGIISVGYNLEVNDDDLMWATPEWAWVGTLFGQVLPSMFYGVPQLAYHAEGPFDAEKTFELVEKYEVTLTFLPPTALRMMKQVDSPGERFDLQSMRIIISGGESVGRDIVDWASDVFAGATIHEAYGQTEHNPVVGDCTALFDFNEGTMGKSVIDKEVAIVDPETAEPVDTGEVGEIAVRYDGDPSHFKGYWKKPKKTARKRKNGWHLMEDLGKMDEDGYIAFQGRKDNVIMCAGHRIGPEEIEETLATHEAVEDSGVIGIPDETRGEVPKAYVKLGEGYEPSETLREDLQTFVKERLAQYEYPRQIDFIDELPLTPTGKVQRFKLEERHKEQEAKP